MTEADWDGDVAVLPYRCEGCGERDHKVRLYESGDPKKDPAWRLLTMHPACWQRRQGEVELGLVT